MIIPVYLCLTAYNRRLTHLHIMGLTYKLSLVISTHLGRVLIKRKISLQIDTNYFKEVNIK